MAQKSAPEEALLLNSVDAPAWILIRDTLYKNIIKTVTEIHALIPDSLLFGSLLFYFLTQNKAFGIFAVFIVEAVISHRIIGAIMAQTTGESPAVQMNCRAGFKTPRVTGMERGFDHPSYPSYSVFSITSIATYLVLAMREFSSTLDAMGSRDWSSRSLAAYICTGLLVVAFVAARLWTSCDKSGEVFTAMVCAIIVGGIFFGVNKALFGKESMNFLGLPYMVDKTAKGEAIYVCAPEKGN
jgi:hypothetical protein